MSLLRIFGYFISEAAVSLRRSWKISLLAILTIAMSIFISGTFLLLSGNLSRVVGQWREEARIIVYLETDSSDSEVEAVRSIVSETPWVIEVEQVSGSEAEERFRQTFVGLDELLNSWDDEPLPPSLEVGFDPAGIEQADFEAWRTALRQQPAVMMVDDDRDWLGQVDTVAAVLGGLGLVVGLALLGAAVVTISSVIRLTAYLYRDEITVMRLAGATELYIRGPFYVEGLIQGLLGGALALAGLFAAYLALNPRSSTVLLGTVLVERFLPWKSCIALLGLAGLAGCLGAIVSLRRETLAAD